MFTNHKDGGFRLLNINRSGEDDLLDIIYSLTSALNTSLNQNDGGSQRPEKLQYVTIDVGTIHHDFRQLVRHLLGDEEKRGQVIDEMVAFPEEMKTEHFVFH